MAEIKDLLGITLTKIEVTEDKSIIYFTTKNGDIYKMHHLQDCCEVVYIDDIVGDLDNLIGTPITFASESTNCDNPKDLEWPDESFTWTFYKLATVKGWVDIKWYGSSSGYYSESVDFYKEGEDE